MLEQADPDRYLGRYGLGRRESALVRAREGTGRVPEAAKAPATDRNHELEHINKVIKNLRKLISRLIDA